jgi:two-component system response regulator DesR
VPGLAQGWGGRSDPQRIEELVATTPDCAVVIVTGHGRAGHLKRALEAGVRGFLPKTVNAAVLSDVVRTVHRGGRCRPGAGRRGNQRRRQLTDAARGRRPRTRRRRAPVEEIATRAHLSAGTVRNRLSAAAAKLGAPNRHAAVDIARRHGWI